MGKASSAKDRHLLFAFRSAMVFLGLFIIFTAIRNQMTDNRYMKNGIITEGRVVDVVMCSPRVEYFDRTLGRHTIDFSVSCQGPSLALPPEVGDRAEVLYNPDTPSYAKIIRIHSSDVTHEYGENTWRYQSLAYAIFGLTFIVVAFIPKRFS